jgi:lysophospholipase L1-like esterase
MGRNSFKVVVGALLFATLTGSLAGAADRFQFGPRERIAFVGNDFFEHEADQCYIETALTARFPDKDLVFRNLGYSGDTVRADARNLCAGWDDFGPPDQGFNRLRDLIGHIQPTVIFVAYGMNESFAGESGLADFQSGLDRMLDMLSASRARIVLLSPIAHQKLPPPLPDPAEHDRSLEIYTRAIESTANKRGLFFVDLFHGFSPQTTDGIHPTAEGYKQTADAIEKGLGYPPEAWLVKIGADGRVSKAVGTQIKDGAASPNVLRFTAIDATLPITSPLLQITGLPVGQYELRADGSIVGRGSADQWAQGVRLADTPETSREEKLRELIIRKNFDFFNDWRAQNDTYILGYRKHEQGRNAPEMTAFEKLAQDADAQIAKCRTPLSTQYELRLQK